MNYSTGERKASIVWLTKTVARLFLAPLFKIKKTGLENLPEKSAFILLPKHQRWEDIPLLSLATPRPLYYIAKYELFQSSISRRLIYSMGGIPLNRERPLESRRSLKMMMGFLKNGEGVVIFPEGTYYVNKMGPGYSGLIRMIRSRVLLPFIPVGIRYSEQRGRMLVRINFGQPIYEKEPGNVDKIFTRIMGEIARLSGF